MELLLIGLLVNLLTFLSERLNVSQTYVALGLSIIGGGVYFYFTNYDTETRKTLVLNVGGIYASSQVVFNLLKKNGILQDLTK